MKRREAAFTLIELMIALTIVMVVLYAAINFFIVTVRQYKVQTKIIETNVEGILGLELFRQDLESLGYGLPWNRLVSYTERTGVNPEIVALTDSPNAPRAVLSINDPSFTVNNSDYIVVKSAKVGMNDAAGKWTTLAQGDQKRTWMPDGENLDNNAYVIVLAVGSTDSNRRSLVTDNTYSTAYTQYSSTSNFVPVDPYSANIVYGIDDVKPVRPFNRAEYYLDNTEVPQRCAPNTGVLVKAVVAHDPSGSTPTLLPLLDCVADMQIVYGLDNNADGVVDNIYSNDISVGMTAADIRTKLLEVRVHLLAQEGQRDASYAYPYDNVNVGSGGAGRSFDFTEHGITGFRNYRWKVYNIVVKPKNLVQ